MYLHFNFFLKHIFKTKRKIFCRKISANVLSSNKTMLHICHYCFGPLFHRRAGVGGLFFVWMTSFGWTLSSMTSLFYFLFSFSNCWFFILRFWNSWKLTILVAFCKQFSFINIFSLTYSRLSWKQCWRKITGKKKQKWLGLLASGKQWEKNKKKKSYMFNLEETQWPELYWNKLNRERMKWVNGIKYSIRFLFL